MGHKMKRSKEHIDETWISLADLLQLCKQSKKKIFAGILICGVLAGINSLMKPVEYLSQATFREKSSKSVEAMPSHFALALLDGSKSGDNSEAISVMKSQMMLRRLIQDQNLQASIQKRSTSFPRLANIRDNLKIELALFKRKQGPIFSENHPELVVKNVFYDGEVPQSFRIFFLNEETFQLFISSKEPPIEGTLGIPLNINGIHFTIQRTESQPLTSQEYILSISPLIKTVEHITNKLIISLGQDDKTLISLKYSDPNRHRSAMILNSLMRLYQDYLRHEQRRISDEQIAYLQIRQEEMKNRLRLMMDEHAAVLSSDAITLGFPDVNSAIDFFAKAQQQYARDQLAIDLELKRLEHFTQDDSIYVSKNHESDINKVLSRIREFKQRADSIELALGQPQEHQNLANQLDELEIIHQYSDDTKQMIALLESGKIPHNEGKLLTDSKYLVKAWCERLNDPEISLKSKELCTTHFLSYLNHLSHLFQVSEKSIREQLTNQRLGLKEFQGIDLETARDLYINYSKELSNTEADTLQKQFIIDQMSDPLFEVSSLSTVLEDDVSKGLINKASTLLLSLKDENNRSVREQERLRSDLSIQKLFISEHLNQTIQLLKLNQNLLKEKIKSLLTATLGLIQQEISVLEKHLSDYIALRQDQLIRERTVIEQHQSELQQEMAQLPKKWVSEKLIDQQMKMNTLMVEEITKLVESKNTSSSLDRIQSAPLDLATIPTQPKAPNLMLFLILGGAFGAFLTIGFIVIRAIAIGIPVTSDNLKLAHLHVSGNISDTCDLNLCQSLRDQDLETLRKLTTFLETIPNHGKARIASLILDRSSPDYSTALAMLMSKMGRRVLLLPLNFDRPAEDEELPGLLQYLQGEVEQPKILYSDYYDIIFSGGLSRFAHESLSSPAFKSLISHLQDQYEWIFITSRSSADSSEVESLVRLSDTTIITIKNQKWEEILDAISIASQSQPVKELSFIMT